MSLPSNQPTRGLKTLNIKDPKVTNYVKQFSMPTYRKSDMQFLGLAGQFVSSFIPDLAIAVDQANPQTAEL